jgi:hypothetical protein
MVMGFSVLLAGNGDRTPPEGLFHLSAYADGTQPAHGNDNGGANPAVENPFR